MPVGVLDALQKITDKHIRTWPCCPRTAEEQGVMMRLAELE